MKKEEIECLWAELHRYLEHVDSILSMNLTVKWRKELQEIEEKISALQVNVVEEMVKVRG